MTESPPNQLKRLRKAAGMTQKDVANLLGTTNVSVMRYEKGERQIGNDVAKKLAGIFNCSLDELFAAPGTLTPTTLTQTVQLVGHVAAGQWREAIEWPEEDRLMIPIPPPDGDLQGLFALEVRGESMNRVFPEGTILICASVFHNQDNPNINPRNGDYVICERRDPQSDLMEATVKTYREIDGKHWLMPESDKPDFQAPIALPGPNGDDYDQAERSVVQITAIVIEWIRKRRPLGR